MTKTSRKRQTVQASTPCARNLHACHPIMQKGGVHEKTNGAKRKKAKRNLQRDIRSLQVVA